MFVDKEAPNIQCADDQLIRTDRGKPTAMVNYNRPRASDNSGNVAHVICSPQSGTNFNMGHTSVTCEAVDGSGNRAACSFRFNVIGTTFKYCLVLI